MIAIILLLIILWAFGLLGHIGGGFINLLLIIALIVFIISMVQGRFR